MNNFDILKNNNSIVRCKNCHWCITGTYKNDNFIQHLCLRVVDHNAAIHVGESEFCEEGCLDRTANEDEDYTNLDILKDNNAVIRCKDCYWWDEDQQWCTYLNYTIPVDLDKHTTSDCFCCHGSNGREE